MKIRRQYISHEPGEVSGANMKYLIDATRLLIYAQEPHISQHHPAHLQLERTATLRRPNWDMCRLLWCGLYYIIRKLLTTRTTWRHPADREDRPEWLGGPREVVPGFPGIIPGIPGIGTLGDIPTPTSIRIGYLYPIPTPNNKIIKYKIILIFTNF